jgi:glycoside/pentoside/hexuronide:cation symporter, GPH family
LALVLALAFSGAFVGNDRGKLGWLKLMAFSSPTFAFAGNEIALGLFLPYFLSQAYGIPLAAIATMILIYKVWDTLNDPLIGLVSDYWPLHQHKRFTPMLWGAPLALLGTAVIFFGAQGLTTWGVVATLVIAALGWTLINVPHGAWALEFTSDPVDRTRVFAARTMVGLAALPFFSLGPTLLEHFYGADVAQEGKIVATIVICTQVLSLIWLRVAMKDDIKTPKVSSAKVNTPKITGGMVWQNVRPLLMERNTLCLMGLFACLGAHMAIKGSLFFFWVRFGLGEADWGWSLILIQAIVGIGSLPLWLWVQSRLGTLITLKITLYLSLLLSLSVLIIPPHSLLALILYGIGSGAVFGVAFTLLRTLLGAFLDRLKKHNPTELGASVYSGFHLFYNLVAALAVSLSLTILSRLGFDPKQAALVAPSASAAIGSVMVWGAAIPAALAIVTAHLMDDDL